jgi:hypothetical protein
MQRGQKRLPGSKYLLQGPPGLEPPDQLLH